MRKLILSALAAASLLPAMASAQTGELRHDRQDIRQQRHDQRSARQEYREDWRDYRRSHGDVFRGPRYIGPRGYRYRVLTPGYRLAPAYFGPRYVIADPGRYRLRPASGALRWVRYGNDVVLVNVRTGIVSSVYTGFFL